jgi:phosphoglycerate dehydrogenase-like enzyme
MASTSCLDSYRLPTSSSACAAHARTHRLFDDRMLSRMSAGALLVTPRGPVVDTAALVEHLAAGHIRAALDVTDPTAAARSSALDAGGALTPHIAGDSLRPRNASTGLSATRSAVMSAASRC